ALVLFCVKSSDTEAAGAQLAAELMPGAVVLSLQTGVDNAPRLAAPLAPSTLVRPEGVYVATALAGPDHGVHPRRGALVLGRWNAAAGQATPEAVQQLFAQAEVPVELASDVDAALWSKLVLNCAYNALSAISRLPYGRLVRGQGVTALMREVVAECEAVAAAE